ncbi:hypothetical protein CaldiYA01_14080 [Caldicellulosiruptor diazotrophicus]|uniref:Uncharacterized protein n=1 Tax=Caldicellulosiruptor diazotrophicus TaxID=2806205 RepID=A0ABM7NMZ6_9FIRM|nr:hypothetical protein CaldiYA01_14080 [Caldicellulosiruptor diazotrophicus]
MPEIDVLQAIFTTLEKINGRLDTIEKRLDKIEQRLDKVEERLDKVEKRLDIVEMRGDLSRILCFQFITQVVKLGYVIDAFSNTGNSIFPFCTA